MGEPLAKSGGVYEPVPKPAGMGEPAPKPVSQMATKARREASSYVMAEAAAEPMAQAARGEPVEPV
jgi:hypothetical protein